MKLTCGCRKIDKNVGPISQGTLLVLFGPAGSGKTTLSLQYSLQAMIMKGRVMYVNTEDPMFVDRLYNMASSRRLKFNSRLFHVFEAKSFDEQHRLIVKILPLICKSYDLIVIDSLTGLFRLEAGEAEIERVLKMLNMQLATLRAIVENYNVACIATSQVRGAAEGEDEYVASAYNALRYWAHIILKLDRSITFNKRSIEIVKHPKNVKIKFKVIIRDEGLI